MQTSKQKSKFCSFLVIIISILRDYQCLMDYQKNLFYYVQTMVTIVSSPWAFRGGIYNSFKKVKINHKNSVLRFFLKKKKHKKRKYL